MTKIICIVFMILLTPDPACAAITDGMKKILHDLFGFGGDVYLVTKLIFIGLGTWILEKIAELIGANKYKNWITILAIFYGLSLFVHEALSIIGDILEIVVG